MDLFSWHMCLCLLPSQGQFSSDMTEWRRILSPSRDYIKRNPTSPLWLNPSFIFAHFGCVFVYTAYIFFACLFFNDGDNNKRVATTEVHLKGLKANGSAESFHIIKTYFNKFVAVLFLFFSLYFVLRALRAIKHNPIRSYDAQLWDKSQGFHSGTCKVHLSCNRDRKVALIPFLCGTLLSPAHLSCSSRGGGRVWVQTEVLIRPRPITGRQPRGCANVSAPLTICLAQATSPLMAAI